MYRVISLRGLWPKRMPELFCYVGQEWKGLEAHPLANPFSPREHPHYLHKYKNWFYNLPNLDELLEQLRADSECGRMPLACWCGEWQQGQPSIRCHAVLIAKTMITRFPQDLERGDW